MCGIYGIINYSGKPFIHAQNVISQLANYTIERGSDAIGIGSIINGHMYITKNGVNPASFNFECVKENAQIIMGHNRLATQGKASENKNNHPFADTKNTFMLAHNGIINNDSMLRRSEKLAKTDIETDSYIIVQLIEKYGLSNLEKVSELLEGSFLVTIADKNANFWVIKNKNPIYMVQFPEVGVYMYASTKDIFWDALDESEFLKSNPYFIPIRIDDEEIVKIDAKGKLTFSRFKPKPAYSFEYDYSYAYITKYYKSNEYSEKNVKDNLEKAKRDYLNGLLSYAEYYNIVSDMLDELNYAYATKRITKKEYEKSSKIVEKYLKEAI